MTVHFFEMLGPDTVSPDSPLSHEESSAVCGKSLMPRVGAVLLTRAQREAAIRRGLAAANSHEAKARHFRALVAQLKEMTDGQA